MTKTLRKNDSRRASRRSGRIRNWNNDRGFGFIAPESGGEDVFVHASAFSNQARRPENNEPVGYEVRFDSRRRRQARNVTYAGEKVRSGTPATRSAVRAIWFASAFVLIVAGLVIAGKLPPFFLLLYLGTSMAAFLVYAWDKSAARNARWRTQESTLHLLGLAGGWPGALVARQIFRHKSKKQSFIVTFWCTAALNSLALIGFLLFAGSGLLQSLTGST